MSKYLIGIIEFACAALNAVYLQVGCKKNRRVVIYYHGVQDPDIPNFRKQMEYLARNCTVVEPSNIRSTEENGTDHMVAITFDDAFVSVVENAVPILKEYELPAGFFVPAGNLGKPPTWEMLEGYPDKNETVISKEQIAELDKQGFEIFSHTISHPLLTEAHEDRLRSELLESRRKLERITGREVLGISYPYGAHDARVCNATKRVGYKFGFTIEPSMVDDNTDQLMIGRFKVSPKDSMAKFKLKIRGAYCVCRYLRAAKRMFLKSFGEGVGQSAVRNNR
ncbi:MAG: polysaccharide deacetylase family protein [Planctomycetota bacterium]|jgi:peptidoglycan/xylan/chitin deacetylase (PgdA/CDA1 family)